MRKDYLAQFRDRFAVYHLVSRAKNLHRRTVYNHN